MRYVEIVFNLPILDSFIYSIPQNLIEEDNIKPGQRVIAPFGKNLLVGYIVNIKDKLDKSLALKNIKDIVDIVDEEPVISQELLKLTEFVSRYYLTSWGEVLHNLTPKGLSINFKTIIELANPDTTKIKSPLQKNILELLKTKKELSLTSLRRQFPRQPVLQAIYSLANKNLIKVKKIQQEEKISEKYIKFVKLVNLPPKNLQLKDKQRLTIDILQETPTKELPLSNLQRLKISKSTIDSLINKNILQYEDREFIRDYYEDIINYKSYSKEPLPLTVNQEKAFNSIISAVRNNEFAVFLLHGVTASGKTEVYLQVIQEVLNQKKTALVLVPEIALTYQLIERFRCRFSKDKVVAFHSKLSKGQKFDQWRLIAQDKAKIVLGPRSCIFAPLKNLGVIIIDEEHDWAYKQQDISPRYHARDVAIQRAKNLAIPIVLGSATPSLESFYKAKQSQYFYLSLPQRIDNRPLPEVEIVDMRWEIRKGNTSILSLRLQEEIKKRIAKNEKIILFLNRRGFSRFIQCKDCGFVYKCTNCSISLVFHRDRRVLICHYCGHQELPQIFCPECKSTRLGYSGFGTQRLEQELKIKLPYAKIQRLDLDISYKKSTEKILKTFKEGDIDVLVGTQLVTKGLDIKEVTLVGVVSADVTLNFPDFRSAERCFFELVQVAGRAGRGKIPGKVIIQTYTPGHYSIFSAKTQSYEMFYEKEIRYREQANYPPFVELVNILIKDKNEEKAKRKAYNLYKSLKEEKGISIIGPAPCRLYRIENFYRWQIMIKAVDKSKLSDFLKEYKSILLKDKGVIVDINPVEML